MLIGLVFRILLRLLAAAFFIGVLAAAAYLFLPAIGDVTPSAVAHSVADAAGAGRVDRGCKQESERTLVCTVATTDGSDVDRYRIRKTGKRCYRGTHVNKAAPREELPRVIDGCVMWRDQAQWFRDLIGQD